MSTEVAEKLQKDQGTMAELREKEKPKISAVVVIRNIEDSFDLLHTKLFTALNSMDQSFEIISVDDGSDDGTYTNARSIACQIKEVNFAMTWLDTGAPLLKILDTINKYGTINSFYKLFFFLSIYSKFVL